MSCVDYLSTSWQKGSPLSTTYSFWQTYPLHSYSTYPVVFPKGTYGTQIMATVPGYHVTSMSGKMCVIKVIIHRLNVLLVTRNRIRHSQNVGFCPKLTGRWCGHRSMFWNQEPSGFFPTTEIRIHCSVNSLQSLGVSEGKEIWFYSYNKKACVKNSFSLCNNSSTKSFYLKPESLIET